MVYVENLVTQPVTEVKYIRHFSLIGEEGEDDEEEDDPDYDPTKDKGSKDQQPAECKQQWPPSEV